MNVRVDSFDIPGPTDTVVVFHGTTADGRDISFGADHRMGLDIALAINIDGPVMVDVEEWQVLDAA